MRKLQPVIGMCEWQ